MKANMRALSQSGQVNCLRVSSEVDADTGEDLMITQRARLIFVSEDVLDRAVAVGERNPDFAVRDNDPDVSVGDMFMIYMNDDGIRSIHTSVHDIFAREDMREEASRYFIADPRAENAVIPMIDRFAFARESLRHCIHEGHGTDDIRSALSLVQGVADEFSAQVYRDPNAFHGDLQAQVFATQIVDAAPNARFEVNIDDLEKYYQEKILREQIALMAPNHPDAVGGGARGNALNEISTDLEGVVARGHMFQAAGAVSIRQNPDNANIAAGFNDLSREVFSKLTTESIDDIHAGMIAPSGVATMRERIEERGTRMEGEWVNRALGAIEQLTSNRMRGYEFEAELYQVGDDDVLLVTDSVSRGSHQAAMVYSWPSDTRVGLADIDNAQFSTITQADIPSDERLASLKATVQQMQIENDARPQLPEY